MGANEELLEPLDKDMFTVPREGIRASGSPFSPPYREDTPTLTVEVEHRHPYPCPISTTAPTSSVA